MDGQIFDLFIGIDQTGAVMPGGQSARPLTCAILQRQPAVKTNERETWRLHAARPGEKRSLGLSELNPRGLCALFHQLEIPMELGATAILVDCVFGLPASVCESLGLESKGARHIWELFYRTRVPPSSGAMGEAPLTSLFGRAVSEAFFAKLRGNKDKMPTPLPRRDCEVVSGANSVFLTRPFQRNVQTGTHRVWRDITADKNHGEWARIWPFDEWRKRVVGNASPDTRESRPWLFESYPTLFWREIFGVRTRAREKLEEAVGAYFGKDITLLVDDWEFIVADPERADAVVLALGGLALQRKKRLFEAYPGFGVQLDGGEGRRRLEGWIAGLPERIEKPTRPRSTRAHG